MFTTNQLDIFNDRYARKDDKGEQVERDPEQMWQRVARAIATGPGEYEDFLSILTDFHFVPGGRILSGAGAEKGKTFYNCYVIPVETAIRRYNRSKGYDRFDIGWRDGDMGADSREAIFDTIGTMVGIMSRGGGVGINWSVLRPKGTYLARVSGTTSGPVSWMDVASRAVGVVEQGGSRRGAAMFMLDDWHPDVEEFIDAKRDNALITNANVSVAVSDDFMAAVREGSDWTLRYPDTSDPAYDEQWTGDLSAWVGAGLPVVDHRTVPARELWARLTDAAHASGEPGIVFLDRYNKLSTANGAERIISVNPCGEQGLGAYSVCNLGAMNLDSYVHDGEFYWGQFAVDVKVAVNFLDNVIDKDSYYVEETRAQQTRLRRIGLGVMGLADALVRLGIRYGSPDSTAFVERVFRTMKDSAIEESRSLAGLRGAAGAWDDSMWNRPYLEEYTQRHPDEIRSPLRNIFLLTQAPTGTTSLFAGVNSGIEPYFNLKTFRRDRTGERWVYAKAVQETYDSEIPDWVSASTSQNVPIEDHIAIQAAAQKYIDSSVSKTVNAPKEQTKEETARVYQLAYDVGLKGLAYYRDGSRDIQVLHHSEDRGIISPFKKMVGSQDITECPDCGGEVTHEEGCKKCYSCGWSAC